MAAIWVAFGTGKNFMYLDINAICYALGKDRSTALPMFHSFTCCDTTSAFFGTGKKSVWEAWNAYVEVTEAFNNLMNHPYMTVTVNCKEFQLLERFTVIIYNKKSNLDSVNEARRELFLPEKQDNGRTFPQRKKPFCSTHCAQSTKLESGQPVIIVSRSLQPQGLWMDSRECNEDLASCVLQPACGIPGLQRTDQVWLQKRHVHVWRTMLMQEGAVEVHITLHCRCEK
ncbi:hypothetical protein GWK47_028830 [Chionoecetes opilio]|uniref:Uncharacterized protein n=1 Tax=Chionoecetes opilio TaxID=41210 RepID=A0A8J4YNM2_CHIOP|nr:hypothetical protein GWK47_028830 [Chionoecetes opilio]